MVIGPISRIFKIYTQAHFDMILHKKIIYNRKISKKKFLFKTSRLIRVVSSHKLKVWKFHKIKIKNRSSYILYFTPQTIRFISYFQSSKKIRNFTCVIQKVEENIFETKTIVSKKKNMALFILYFKNSYVNKFLLRKCSQKKFNYLFNIVSSNERIQSAKYKFKKKKELNWNLILVKQILFCFYYPYRHLNFGNLINFCENRKNTSYLQSHISRIKYTNSIRSKLIFSKFSFIYKGISFKIQYLILSKFFQNSNVDKDNKNKKLFALILGKKYIEKEKFLYILKKYSKNLHLEHKLRGRQKKKAANEKTHSYCMIESFYGQYIAMDFDSIFCFILINNRKNFWNINEICGLIITKRFQTEKKKTGYNVKKTITIPYILENFLNISVKFHYNKSVNTEMAIEKFLILIGKFDVQNNRNKNIDFIDAILKKRILEKRKTISNLDFSPKRLFANGVKLLLTNFDYFTLHFISGSKYYLKILSFILTKIQTNQPVIKEKSNYSKKIFTTKYRQSSLEVDSQYHKKNRSNEKLRNKYTNYPIVNVFRESKQEKNSSIEKKIHIENIIKNLKNYYPEKFFPYFKKSKTCKNCTIKKVVNREDKKYISFHKFFEGNLFYKENTNFSNRIGYFLLLSEKKLFFVSYKFAFDFLVFNRSYIQPKRQGPIKSICIVAPDKHLIILNNSLIKIDFIIGIKVKIGILKSIYKAYNIGLKCSERKRIKNIDFLKEDVC
nr:hypothetical protein 1634Bnrm3_p130 [Cryptomonas sp.]